MAWHQPFDLYYWFVNVFAGNITIFLIIAFIVMAALAGMFRMSVLTTGMMFGLFMVMFSVFTGNLYIVALFIVALILGWTLTRFLK